MCAYRYIQTHIDIHRAGSFLEEPAVASVPSTWERGRCTHIDIYVYRYTHPYDIDK